MAQIFEYQMFPLVWEPQLTRIFEYQMSRPVCRYQRLRLSNQGLVILRSLLLAQASYGWHSSYKVHVPFNLLLNNRFFLWRFNDNFRFININRFDRTRLRQFSAYFEVFFSLSFEAALLAQLEFLWYYQDRRLFTFENDFLPRDVNLAITGKGTASFDSFSMYSSIKLVLI